MRGWRRVICFSAALALLLSCALPVAAQSEGLDSLGLSAQPEAMTVEGPDLTEEIALILETDKGTFALYTWDAVLPDTEKLAVEYAVGESGDWIRDTEYPGAAFPYGKYGEGYLQIDKTLLEPETDYCFRIRYEEQVSNTVALRISTEEAETWKYKLEVVSPLDFELHIFPVGGALSGFELPDTIACQYGGRFFTLCEVVWDDPAQVDTSKPGWTVIRGEIIPPYGFYAEPGFAAYYPVMLVEEGMEQEAVDCSGYRDFFIVGKGTTAEELALREHFYYTTQNGLSGEFSVSWDLSAVDLSEVGRYPLTVTTDLPVCFSLPQVEIAVVESDRIDLSAFSLDMGRIICDWVYEIADYENITLQYSFDGEVWQDAEAAPEHGYMIVSGDIEGHYTGKSLTVYAPDTQSELFIRLIYRDEPSNVLHIERNENGMLLVDWWMGGDRGGADQEPQNPPDIEQPAPDPDPTDDDEPPSRPVNPPGAQQPAPGSDDGDGTSSGDSRADGATEDKPGSQAAPAVPDPVPEVLPVQTEAAPQAPAAAGGTGPRMDADAPPQDGDAGVMMEYSTANTLSISGLRLREMLALAGDTVPFEKQGISVELPAGFLAGLEASDRSRFEVRIYKRDNGFALEIFLDEVPLSDLPPTAVYVPFAVAGEIDSENLACFDAQGEEVSAAVYDPARQVARVEIPSTGSYTIAERTAVMLPISAQETGASIDGGSADGANEPPGNGIIVITVGLAAALCAGVVFLRRGGGKAGGDG